MAIDKAYIKNMKESVAKCIESIDWRLSDVRNTDHSHGSSSWHHRYNEREIMYDCIDKLFEIVQTQQKMIDTVCNNMTKSERKADVPHNDHTNNKNLYEINGINKILYEIQEWVHKNNLQKYANIQCVLSKDESNKVDILLVSSNPGILIGYHGKTIDELKKKLSTIESFSTITIKEGYEMK